jgi:hypothetical protein
LKQQLQVRLQSQDARAQKGGKSALLRCFKLIYTKKITLMHKFCDLMIFCMHQTTDSGSICLDIVSSKSVCRMKIYLIPNLCLCQCSAR